MRALAPAANLAVGGHGPTVVVLVAVGLLVLIVGGAAGRRRVRRSRARSGDGSGRAAVVGIVLLGLVLGATVTGGRIAPALVTALVAIGHALIGLLP